MYDLCIIGSGPAGFAAATYAAQKDMRICLIEKSALGGVCLNSGCIPTKTLLHTARIFSLFKSSQDRGINIASLDFNQSKNKQKKDQVVDALRSQMFAFLKSKKVEVIFSEAELISADKVKVSDKAIKASNIILALGSSPIAIDSLMNSEKIIFSGEALDLQEIPGKMLIIGAGYIGCEFAQLFSDLGSDVTIIEATSSILPNMDSEISSKLKMIFEKRGIKFLLNSYADEKILKGFDKVLVCVGRKPNVDLSGIENIGLNIENSAIKVDEYLKTSIKNIYAVGDCVGSPMLAHVASFEARCAVDNILGNKRKVDYSLVPGCIYTDPQVASVGISQEKAKDLDINSSVKKFMFKALGKAQAISSTKGLIKIIINDSSGVIIGADILGPEATEIIATLSVAIKCKMKASELKEVIFAHPTLSEIISETLHF